MKYIILCIMLIVVSTTFGGWIQLRDIPTSPEPNGRGVKDGGALVTYGNLLYAFQGHNTRNFFTYDPTTNIWSIEESIPNALKPNGKPDKKGVKQGGALVATENAIYAFKGGNTAEFWAFDVAADIWFQKTSIPHSSNNKRVKGGGALVYLNGIIYAFKGGNTYEFWAYNPQADTLNGTPWIQKADIIGDKGVKDGGAMVAWNNKIYALKGNNTFQFLEYDPSTNQWNQLAQARFCTTGVNVDKKVKQGGALTILNDKIYAFKGGNTECFGCYDPTTNTWTQLENIPVLTVAKRVNHGGSLTTYNGIIYGLKGHNSKEFWAYTPTMR